MKSRRLLMAGNSWDFLGWRYFTDTGMLRDLGGNTFSLFSTTNSTKAYYFLNAISLRYLRDTHLRQNIGNFVDFSAISHRKLLLSRGWKVVFDVSASASCELHRHQPKYLRRRGELLSEWWIKAQPRGHLLRFQHFNLPHGNAKSIQKTFFAHFQ